MTAGLALAYPGRLNGFHGPSGGGKTWLAILAAVETVRKGALVAVIDYEDHPNGWALRLVQIGCSPDESARIDYMNPHGDLFAAIGSLERRAARLGREWGLVIVDSIGEAISRAGGNPNDDRDVAPFMTTARLLTKLPGNPGVILLDHVTKAAEDGQQNDAGPAMHAAGSFRKRAAYDGASYAVEVKVSPAKGKPGRLAIYVAKDRHGNRPQRAIAAYAELEPCDGLIDGCLTIRLVAPKPTTDSDGKFRPTGLMERVSRWLEVNPGASGRQVVDGVKGKGEYVRKALVVLEEEGYVSRAVSAKAMLYGVIKPYREADDTPPAATEPDRVPPRPTASRPRPGRGPESPEVDRVPASRAPDVVGLGGDAVDGSGWPMDTPNPTPTASPVDPELF